jgi:hypothetical protein
VSASSALARARALSDGLAESTCVITRAGATTVDHATGGTSTTPSTIYTGPCRLRFPFVRPQQALADGQVLDKARGILSLPISVPTSANVRTNDVVTVTVNPEDPASAGVTLRM